MTLSLRMCCTIPRVRSSAVLLLAFVFASVCAWSQNHAQAQLSHKLLSVHVKGLEHMKESEVVRASGLELGQNAGEQDFQQAVQKLGDTGLFTGVAYTYHYTTAGADLEFEVKENPKLVPILFDNFVWFSDEELLLSLRARVPLFDGKLPLQGSLDDQVANALNSILEEHKISGRAEGLQSGALNAPISSYTYAIKFHPVIVRDVEFPGAGPAEVPALQTAAQPISGQEYLRSAMRPHAELNLLPVYLARGYLKAHFDEPKPKIVTDGPRTLVDISFPVIPGAQYRTTRVQWTGNMAFPADKLQSMIHLAQGEPANAVQLQSDLDAVKRFYATKGYLMASVTPRQVTDDTASTVAYNFEVVEGDVFHMGELETDGIDPSAASKLAAQWQMKKGDIFDVSYLHRFFEVLYHDFGLSRSYSVIPKQTVNRQQKTVNVTLRFVPKK
jgi:outer membrane protein assembly factor BamA